MGSKWKRWRLLSRAERRQLTRLAIALPLMDVALRALGFRRLRDALDRATPGAGSQPATAGHLQKGESLARLAVIAGHHIPLFNTTCLRQALYVYWQLRRHGLAPDLKIGVMPHAGALDAHAWVELDGTALAQPGLAHRAFAAGPGSA